MKTIYSLQEFRNQILEIAKLKNEEYTTVEVRVDSKGAVIFNAYINGEAWFKADTMEECVAYFRNKITKPPIKSIDVEIEMPESAVTTATDDLPH